MSVKDGLIRAGSSIKNWTCKNSPTILTVTAVATSVGAVVTAVVAARRMDYIFHDANEEITAIHAKMADDNLIQNGRYSVRDGRKDLFKVYLKTGGRLVKLFLPTALLLGTSVASALGSHKILSDRNAAAMAAYELISNSYEAYRGRVRNKIGEEKEQELYEAKDISPTLGTTTDKKTGEVKPVVKKIFREGNEFDVVWDECSTEWDRSTSLSLSYIMAKESYLTTVLHTVGHLTYFDALQDMGYDVVKRFGEEKAEIFKDNGWVYSDDPKDPAYGTVVSFGVATLDAGGCRNLNARGMAMLRGETNIILHPNIFGYIHDGEFSWAKYDKGIPMPTHRH